MKQTSRKIYLITVLLLVSVIPAFSAPKRIVSLSPSGTEILFAIGADTQIVARTDYCNYPSEALYIPSTGGFDGSTLSVESILSYDPDFVYGSKGMHELIAQQLRELGIEVYLSDATSIDQVINEILYIGKYTGHKKQAEAVASKIKNTEKSVSKKISSSGLPTVSVYYEVWSAPYMSAGKSSFISDIIETAGGNNIFSDVTAFEYPTVSEEEIIARNPSYIIIPAENGETQSSVASRNGWNSIEAVKNNSIYMVDSDVFSRPGPRICEAIVSLARILYPSINFDDIEY